MNQFGRVQRGLIIRYCKYSILGLLLLIGIACEKKSGDNPEPKQKINSSTPKQETSTGRVIKLDSFKEKEDTKPKKVKKIPGKVQLAVARGSFTEIRQYLADGGDINLKELKAWTFLHYAAQAGKYEICQFLLDNGADPEIRNDAGHTPLQVASRSIRRNEKVIQLLSPEKDQKSYKSLIEAVENGDLQSVQELLGKGADANEIDAEDRQKRSALHFAAGLNHHKICELLIKNGARPSVTTRIKRYTPLMLAIVKGNIESVDVLTNPDIVRGVQSSLNQVYFKAVTLIKVEICELLLSKGADPRERFLRYSKRNALEISLEDGPSEFFDLYKKHKIEIPFWALCRHGDVQEVKAAIKNSKVNELGPSGIPPIVHAIKVNNVKVVEFLVANGADLNLKARGMNVGYTPLHYAVQEGNIKVIDTLVKNGSNVNEKPKNQRTPLYLAVMKKNVKVIELLISSGADPDIVPEFKGPDGEIARFPLERIAGNNEEILKLLKKKN